jgi:signal transduction histidine kinase
MTAAGTSRARSPDLVNHERERFARDLHDVALSRMIRLGFELSAIGSGCRSPLDARIQAVVEDVDALIHDLRSMVFDLLDSPDHDPDIEVALRVLLEDAEAHMGTAGELSVRGPVRSLPPEIARHVHAVAQEALHNVMIHSGASHLAVFLTAQDHALELCVTDDGIGPPETPVHGLGLGSMAARARELHGTLMFGPGAARGTVLRWRVPC